MARLDAGAVQLNKQDTPLNEFIGTILTRLQKRLAGRQLTVKLPQGRPMLYADPLMIEQVLSNLLENALRYTPEHSPIEISAKTTETTLDIAVTDQGPGIPIGLEDKLFEKFYRVHQGDTQSGVGLGLSICKAIITAHGGSIQAQNKPTGGAIFSFSLPQEHRAKILPQTP
jgi:two-component system sensor histidine kinase KdpD